VLLGLPPLLTPDLLRALAAMGHGDEIAIVDANFPAESVGRRVIAIAGVSSTAVLDAVLRVLPLDTFVSPAAVTMEVVGDPRAVPPPVAEFGTTIAQRTGDARALGHLARQVFYERARNAFAVVQSGDGRPYANILLVKGVVRPDAVPP
jgi:L-fucose mutarotase